MTGPVLNPENEKEKAGNNRPLKPGLSHVLVPVALILAATLLALSFLKKREHTSGDGHSHTAGAPLKIGDTFPDFELRPLEGQPTRISALQGKVFLINVWATWCGPCIAEMPSIVKLREKFNSQGFEVIGINVDEQPEEVLRPFEKRFGMKFPSYIDPEGRFSEQFGVSSIPISVVINADRKILHLFVGDKDWFADSIQKKIETWLQGKDA